MLNKVLSSILDVTPKGEARKDITTISNIVNYEYKGTIVTEVIGENELRILEPLDDEVLHLADVKVAEDGASLKVHETYWKYRTEVDISPITQ